MTARAHIRRVALVSPYDFAASGGVNAHVRHLATQLRREDIDVTILAPSSDREQQEPGLVKLGPITSVPINGSVARTTLSPGVTEEVATLLARERFDVVHLHEPFVPMLPLSVLNASHLPNIGTFHASGQRSFSYAASRRFVQWLAQRLTVRVAVSEAAAAFIQRYIGGDYTIIPNGVDTEHFRPDVPPVAEWHDGRPNVLFVGRFDEPRKGFPVLIDAWADVQHARPDARLLVVGRGDIEGARERVHSLGLENVHFVGAVDDTTLARYYTTAQVFCAPSTGQESFGIVLVEAMSSGTPIVASDISGYRQVLRHRQEGMLVQPQQPSALATSLLHILDDAKLRAQFGKTGRETAQQYAWAGITHRLLDVYDQARTLHQLRETPKLLISVPVPEIDLQSTAPQSQYDDVHAFNPAIASPQAVGDVQQHVTRGEDPMLPKSLEDRVRALTQRVAGQLLGRFGISPNTITAVGLLLTLLVTVTLWSGHLVWGGILVLVTSAFDMFDGALARATDRKSAFGAFFDSTVDRYTEALILLGILLYYESLPGVRWEVPLVYISIVGSLMVSYTRARAEALGFDGKTGILARPERIILLSFGLLVGWLPFALAILALFTNFTAAQRVYYVWVQERRNNPRPAIEKVPRRSRLASRDHHPS